MTENIESFGYVECEIGVDAVDGVLGATLCLPDTARSHPAALIVGGSLSLDRNGAYIDADRPWIPARDALARLAHRLAQAGIASLRYDRRSTLSTESFALDLARAFDLMRWHESVNENQTCVLGESAGAYWACLGAELGARPTCYVLLGALFSSIEQLFAYNFDRARRYASSSSERWEWVRRKAPRDLLIGERYRDLIAAAYVGEDSLRIGMDGCEMNYSLSKMRYELTYPPATLFALLQRPTLILQGAHDMNVPIEDAFGIAAALRESGVEDVEAHMIEGVDHSFQESARTYEERLRDRISLDSFRRPYAEEMYATVIGYLNKRFGRFGHG